MEQEKDDLSPQNAEEIVGTAVYIETEIEIPGWIGKSGGSGFFVGRDKIVTCFHGLAGSTKVTVTHVDTGTVYTIEGIIASDYENDLVVLKTAEEDTPFRLGNSEAVQKDARIYAVGFHGDKKDKIEGTIRGAQSPGKRLRLNLLIVPGWSGCPLLNSSGEAIGVCSAGVESENAGYAIPSNILKTLLASVASAKIESWSTWQKRPEVLAYTAYTAAKKNSSEVGIFQRIWRGRVKGAFYAVRAYLKQVSGDYAGAIAIYDKIIEDIGFLAISKVEAYAARGIANGELGDYRKAIEDANQAIVVAPVTYVGYYSRGYTRIRWAEAEAEHGNHAKSRTLYEKAINDYTESLQLDSKKTLVWAKVYNEQGWTKYLMGKLEIEQGNTGTAQTLYQEAVNECDKALQSNPKGTKPRRAATYHTRGTAKAALEDHEGAIEDFNNAIRLRPKKALYYNDRGLSNEALGQHEAAEADFTKAKELDPKLEK
ncbi:MAG: trypsin-like peptidase domain-containing protein [Candidatus Poribacteria bacterium]|nr:trypsin-like peptidase domain-containing protein [Candidatus Poribacteria bacterium]